MARIITNTFNTSIFGTSQDRIGVVVTRNVRGKSLRMRFDSWHHDVVRSLDELVLLAGRFLLGDVQVEKLLKQPAAATMAGRMPAYGWMATIGSPCLCPVIS